MAAFCRRCPKYRSHPSPYVLRLEQMHLLKLAGYPWSPNDMPMQMWLDLGVYEYVLAQRTPTIKLF